MTKIRSTNVQLSVLPIGYGDEKTMDFQLSDKHLRAVSGGKSISVGELLDSARDV